MKLRKCKDIDVLFIAEGTYPFVRGGVSTWIHQIITGMKDLNFGIIFIGSRKEDYGKLKYELPPNLVFLENLYLFSGKSEPGSAYREGKEDVRDILCLLREDEDIPDKLSSIHFYRERITPEDFLYGKRTWEALRDFYFEIGMEVPFISFLWTIRNILTPLWKLADFAYEIVRKNLNVALIHSPSTGYAGFLGCLLKDYIDTPLIITEHGIYTRERKLDILSSCFTEETRKQFIKDFKYVWINFFLNLGKICYRKADRIFSLFEGARYLQITMGCDPSKAFVIPNGVKPLPFRSKWEKEKKIIGLIGRVTPIKDVKTFIKALKILSHSLPKVEAWIVGPEEEDPEYATECKIMVKALGIERNVKFLGFKKISEVLPYIKVLVLSSISEGMPMVILEAFSAGIPCVSTDVGSCRQLIEGGLNEEDRKLGKAGELVKVGDYKGLAHFCKTLLEDRNLWEQYSNTAFERARRFYSYENFIDSYRSVYLNYGASKNGRCFNRA